VPAGAALPLASVTGSITSAIGNHGLEAIFLLMLVGALLPIGSELVMIYGGAVASGAIAGSSIAVLGHEISSGSRSFVAVALAGSAGNLVGAAIGWAVGAYGGRAFVERRGRWLHASEARLARADRWFERFGAVAVPLGFLTPLVRSFVAIPAGIARVPPVRFVLLAALGVLPFCFGLSAAGWAVGSHWERLQHALRYVEIAILVLAVAGIALFLLCRRGTVRPERAEPSPAELDPLCRSESPPVETE
jgi:membrane protein DedA with SNARE-associated domain